MIARRGVAADGVEGTAPSVPSASGGSVGHEFRRVVALTAPTAQRPPGGYFSAASGSRRWYLRILL